MRHFVQDVMSGYDNKGVGSFDLLRLRDEATTAGVVFAAMQYGLENAPPPPSPRNIRCTI